jgi:hypothetical protein
MFQRNILPLSSELKSRQAINQHEAGSKQSSEDGGDKFLRNIRISFNYVAL